MRARNAIAASVAAARSWQPPGSSDRARSSSRHSRPRAFTGSMSQEKPPPVDCDYEHHTRFGRPGRAHYVCGDHSKCSAPTTTRYHDTTTRHN